MTGINPLQALLNELRQEVLRFYGGKLVSLAVFGSVARKAATPDSDIDLLVIARDLPRGRVARVGEFTAVERALKNRIRVLQREGYCACISPVIKTPEEALAGSPLFWDMTLDVLMLFDPESFLQDYLGRVRDRLAALGAKRIVQGDRWYWDLKPDYKRGEVFEL